MTPEQLRGRIVFIGTSAAALRDLRASPLDRDMGIWFLSQFFGNLGAGMLGGLWESLSRPVFFTLLAGIAFLAGVLVMALLRPLRRVLGTSRETGVRSAQPEV